MMFNSNLNLAIDSPNIVQNDQCARIVKYTSHRTMVKNMDSKMVIHPVSTTYDIKTELDAPSRLGLLLVGLGGNNGSTLLSGLLANKLGLKWMTKRGVQSANFIGSLVMSSSVYIGLDEENNKDVHIPMHQFAPFCNPNNIIVSGWDINGANMAEAVKRAQVLEPDLQEQLYPMLSKITPLPSYYHSDFIASNQQDRANNCLSGSKAEILSTLRSNIASFKKDNSLDKVIVMWTANTERFTHIDQNVHNKSVDLLDAIEKNYSEISPSTLFAIASILEGSCFINGSPQNTLVPGVIELATHLGVPVAGDDFKTGQTKLKSVLADFLISSGLKPLSIVSYNHLGNNDGRNLAEAAQFRSKEISKSGVLDDILESSPLLKKSAPNHRIVIEYIPAVGDSKRAMDEYESEIFLGGRSTISIFNICEDSLLAAPLMLDLVLLSELLSRISIRRHDEIEYRSLNPVLSLLSFMLKAPLVPQHARVVNAFTRQRRAIEGLLRAINGLPPIDELNLEARI